MSIQRLSYLGFEVSDIAAWRAFAADKLGLMESSAVAHRARFRIDSRAWRLSVDKGQADDLSFSGYEVDSEEALTAVKKRLEARGVAVLVEGQDIATDRGVLGLVSCKDPAGNRVEICYGPTEVFETPFISPAGVSGFLTGDQGFGHYVLNVPDASAALDFYIKGLGLHLSDIIDWKLSDELTVRIYFLHCNGRHHTLALGSFPGDKALHHFMLEATQFDDVGFALEKFEADGAIVATLGRHTNDHMVSFYGATPSGFAVEYGWGARQVETNWSVVRYDKISVWGHRFIGLG
ncbi:biphenyl-2,3-diol 1,2-dioxygenase [Croceicoccus sp. Ery5]|uniref:biphenyl-2,3-diol 1,2-dioxygenase n=1 Tax=Croceicoccus sp. Ery5 TaxID=1703340 RepID=UPI001E41B78C|nr:biphenyl-2,3-diol 1,2-dioxygenase [Croceicoccus sp. Ery5]